MATNTSLSLIEFLQNERGKSIIELDKLKEEHIDETTLPLMSEDELIRFLPLKGDRLAARRFCDKRTDKKSLIDRLSEKFSKTKESTKPRNRGIGNANASKPNRKVEIGWLDFHKADNTYKQVRSQKGGGTRIVSFSKQDKDCDVLERSKHLFFPNGNSKRGPVTSFTFMLCDFMQNPVNENCTVNDMYVECSMRMLRLYMCSKKNDSHTDDTDSDLPEIHMPKKKKKGRLTSELECGLQVEDNSNHDTNTAKGTDESRVENHSGTITKEKTELGIYTEGINETAQLQTVDQIVNFPCKDILSTAASLSGIPTFNYKDSDVSFEIPLDTFESTVSSVEFSRSQSSDAVMTTNSEALLLPVTSGQSTNPSTAHLPHTVMSTDSEALLLPVASKQSTNPSTAHLPNTVMSRNSKALLLSVAPGQSTNTSTDHVPRTVMSTDSETLQEGLAIRAELDIHRGPLAFKELICYFKDESISEKVLTINRILPNGERERAEDTGGVLRDLLTEFWSTFYDLCTLGRQCKVPSLRHDFGATELEAIGCILVYGYKVTGYWQVLLAKSFVQQIIFPESDRSTNLLEDFFSYVSSQDKDVMKRAIEDYGSVDTDELLESLDMYECKTATGPHNIKPVILEIAHTHIIQKPVCV